ncbi:hypothetical protein ACFCZ1_37930 [Streptomyces sp. NPDC056224]|uniref:hypothetical protein n=1 Tax=Streptomyces sp. NPDC056224 TaxID=3345750 RepID=UPI0035DB876E
MPRAKWVVAALTVVLLSTGISVLQRTEGATPSATTTDDALPSRALGLSDHRRLARQREHSGEHTPGQGARSPRTAPGPLRAVTGPMRPARPVRLRVPSLDIDVPLAGARSGQQGHEGRDSRESHGEAFWDTAGPPPGSAGTAVVTGSGLDLAGLQRGRTVEISRADGRTAVFTVVRISPGEAPGHEGRAGRAQLRLIGGETAVLARLTGQRRGR